MTIIKGMQGDISPAFFERLDATFPERAAVWQPGDDLPECARKAGCREVIEWIRKHAVKSTSSG